MTSTRRILTAVALTATLALAGCSTGAEAEDGRISVVASTNVYGQIVEAIGGDAVSVVSIVSSASQDPHSFEASARDQLSVSRADLVVMNGGGYDAFMDALVDGAGAVRPVVPAVEFSEATPPADHGDHDHDHGDDDHDHDHDHDHSVNEHVWYDPHVMAHLAEAISMELSALDPDNADAFAANLAEFTNGIDEIESTLGTLSTEFGGAEIFVTEPVSLYLTEAAGLVNIAPDDFTHAVEDGRDVPAATLLAATKLLQTGQVAAVVVNRQTGGAETTAITDDAASLGIPVVEFSETLPEGQTYLEWMQANVTLLGEALRG
ncbi:metal ABC transporter solute-binding protein, Zn/Mn family [Microbacterium sp. NPDC055910]|uniref:metal ABC transporter solute-binding protein, Zn/Mn family n=1 Tax=Microbacterium sp. NPDC055910 TaxID=3345659 RepID=UPI0035DD8F7A